MISSIGQIPTFFNLAATTDEILSWVIEIWMKGHLVSENNYNTVDLQSLKHLQGLTNKVGLTFTVGDTGLKLVLSKTIGIGNTKYHG